MIAEASIIFGDPQEWDLFRKRHSLFFERFPNLQRAIEVAFLRKFGKESNLLPQQSRGRGALSLHIAKCIDQEVNMFYEQRSPDQLK